ncbi:MAG: DUF805 domain-containing protein [Bacteroidales bacterium]|nr:DUF805 domain-containing protein [Bacteroidales bacterium]
MKPILTTLKKYASFRDVASHQDFWSWAVFAGLVVGGLFTLVWFTDCTTCAYILWTVCVLLLLPTLAVTVRRLHDVGRSGWWVALWAILLVGTVLYGFLSGYLLQHMTPGDTVSPFTSVFFPILSVISFAYSLMMLFWLASPGKVC